MPVNRIFLYYKFLFKIVEISQEPDEQEKTSVNKYQTRTILYHCASIELGNINTVLSIIRTLTRTIKQTSKPLTDNYEKLGKIKPGLASPRSKPNRAQCKIRRKQQRITIRITYKLTVLQKSAK